MSRTANHIHRYKKENLAAKGKEPYFVYKCMKPACPHYIPLHLAEGKLCECNRCGEPMVISKVSLYGSAGRAIAKPHCPDCTKKKKDNTSEVAAIADFLNRTGTE